MFSTPHRRACVIIVGCGALLECCRGRASGAAFPFRSVSARVCRSLSTRRGARVTAVGRPTFRPPTRPAPAPLAVAPAPRAPSRGPSRAPRPVRAARGGRAPRAARRATARAAKRDSGIAVGVLAVGDAATTLRAPPREPRPHTPPRTTHGNRDDGVADGPIWAHILRTHSVLTVLHSVSCNLDKAHRRHSPKVKVSTRHAKSSQVKWDLTMDLT